MGNWKTYLFSIIVCTLSCSILSQLVSNGKRKALMRLITGTAIAVSILYPLSGMSLKDLFTIPLPKKNAAEYYIAEGENTALEAQEKLIKDACETYILDKAKTLGSNIVVEVALNTELIPDFVELRGEVDTDLQLQLEKILTADLGIPKENQKWIWNQESNSS